jgi:GT2 family glycosyltransferase
LAKNFLKGRFMSPQIFIIILNWNDFQSTLQCLESLKLLTYPNYKILVVDNGSTNESIQVLSELSNIELHQNEHNLGFAGGNNQAIKKAISNGADYVWLLNNDAIVEPDCLTKLVNSAENDKQIGLVSPVIYDSDDRNKIQHSVTRFDLSYPLMEGAADIDTATRWQSEMPFGISLWGTALLIPKKTIEKIGLLDEHLFAYCEDVDYSIRSTKAGFKNVCIFDTSIWHKGHIGHRKPHYYYYEMRNTFYLWKKHATVVIFLKIIWWRFIHTRSHISNLKGHPEQIEACLLGVWDALRNLGGEYNANRKAPWLIRFLLIKN